MMSSAANRFISNEQAIPVIETDIFRGNSDMPLAITRLNTEDVMSGGDPVALAYTQLRANVYINQTGMISPSNRQNDGGERDSDDPRSVHFASLENRGDGRAAVVGAIRLIHKTDASPENLPIEDLFFDPDNGINEIVADTGSFEVSRYISINDNRRRARLTKVAVIGAGLAHAVESKWTPCFAVVEPCVERDLSRTGVPIGRITEPKLIEKYNDTNVAIEVYLDEYVRRLGKPAVSNMYLQEHGVRFYGK